MDGGLSPPRGRTCSAHSEVRRTADGAEESLFRSLGERADPWRTSYRGLLKRDSSTSLRFGRNDTIPKACPTRCGEKCGSGRI
jgi:hypothetical protein